MARSSSNRNSASARASSVLPTPVGPRKRKLPIGRFGSPRPARERRTAFATASTAASCPTTRFFSSSSMWRSLCISPCIILVTGIPVHLETIAGDVLIGDLFAQVARLLLHLRERLAELLDLLLELGDRAVRDLGGAPEVALALRQLRFVAEPLDLGLRLADLLDDLLLALPLRLHRAGALLELGDLALHVLEARLARRVALLLQRLLLDLELHQPARDRVDLGRHAVDFHLDLGGGLVDEVDRLVGQEAVGHVAIAQRRRGDRAPRPGCGCRGGPRSAP